MTFSRGFIGIAPCLHPAWSAPPTQAGGGGWPSCLVTTVPRLPQLHTHHSNISNTVTCRQEEGLVLVLVLVLVVAGRRGAGPSAGWPAVRRLWRLLPPSSISAVRWWPCRGAHCVTLSRYVTCHVSRCSHQWSPGDVLSTYNWIPVTLCRPGRGLGTSKL